MKFTVLIFGLLLFVNCKKPTIQTVVLPENLRTTVAANGGNVEVVAEADKVNFYTVTFFRNNDSTVIQTNDGIADYTYTQSGTYRIKSRAHTTFSDFIEKNDTISVNADSILNQGYSTPLSYPNMTLVWNDEFDGNSLSSDWTYDIGNGNWGWGNNELEYYRTDNATVENGLLTITAKQESFGGQNYTSSRIKTQGLKSFKYGRIDIRAKLPFGKGIWPALWMLGDNISTVGWPSCGEIDIMELVGGSGTDKTVHGTAHWADANGNRAYIGGSNSLSSGIFNDQFHVFSIVWDTNSIKWYRDNIEYYVLNTTAADLAEFDERFFFIFNVAVGGNWPGNPDATTVFPQKMIVDYVRVFQQ
jgi:beta-glucanase (GH16 family)